MEKSRHSHQDSVKTLIINRKMETKPAYIIRRTAKEFNRSDVCDLGCKRLKLLRPSSLLILLPLNKQNCHTGSYVLKPGALPVPSTVCVFVSAFTHS